MATPDDQREASNGVVLGLAMFAVVMAVCWVIQNRGCDQFTKHEPTQVLPAPGEHSLLVEEK